MPTSPGSYKSAELYLSAYLLATGSTLKTHEHQDDHTVFVFDNEDGTVAKVKEFFNNKPVPVGSFVNALLNLRHIIRRRQGERR